jgi:hypothetical protein
MMNALPARQGFELVYLKIFAANKRCEVTGINDLQKANENKLNTRNLF